MEHILTSVLPFGYKNGKYRFSLCIDLNPNYNTANAITSVEGLNKFLANYASKDGIFDQLVSNLVVEVGGKKFQGKECFTDFTKSVRDNWDALPKEIFKHDSDLKSLIGSTKKENLEYNPGPDLSAQSIITMFNGSIPDVQEIRKSAIARLEDSKSKGIVSDFTVELGKEIARLSADVASFGEKLSGIASYSYQDNYTKTERMVNRQAETSFDTLDEILEIWSFFDSNILLQRLMGRTIDFEILESDLVGLGKEQFIIKFSTTTIEKNLTSLSNLTWHHLETPIKLYKDLNLAIVEEESTIANINPSLHAMNHDAGGKLVALASVEKKYKDYLTQLNDPTKKESERYAIQKELLSIDTAALTTGVTIYDKSLEEFIMTEEKVSKKDLNYLHKVTRGHRFAVESDAMKEMLTPIGQRGVTLKGNRGSIIKLPTEFKLQDFAINTDSGSHALMNGATAVTSRIILDEALLTWCGENIAMPSVFSNNENEENFEAKIDEGAVNHNSKMVIDAMQQFFSEDFSLIGVKYSNSQTNHKYVKEMPDKKNLSVVIEYNYNDVKNKKLIFGRSYNIVKTPELRNGFAVDYAILKILNTKLNQVAGFQYQKNSYYQEINQFQFRRNEPIKPIQFYLQEPLSKTNGIPIAMREGESLTHLAIRALEPNKPTTQWSVRHILPAEVPSFQFAMWSHKLYEPSMISKDAYNWYMKYHFPANVGEPYMAWDTSGEWNSVMITKPDGKTELRTYTDSEALLKSTRMLQVHPSSCLPNYLPDPMVTGFRFEYYLDKDMRISAKTYRAYEQQEYYFAGNYPDIISWKLVMVGLTDYSAPRVLVNEKDFIITVYVENGQELFVSARTILDEQYEEQFEAFGNYNDFTKYGNNDLLTPPLDFSMIHACQRVLVSPKINNTLICKKEKDKTNLTLVNSYHIEQLSIYDDKGGIVHYVEGTLPTGNVELYAKWEEYVDDPNHIISDNWTPNSPINTVDLTKFAHKAGDSPATFEATADLTTQLSSMVNSLIKTGEESNASKNYEVTMSVNYDVRETKYMEKWFWIKNRSKFTSYFPKTYGVIDSPNIFETTSKEFFNRISAKPFLVKILNNKKPAIPVLAERNMMLVSVKDDQIMKSGQVVWRKSSMNRLRFYFKRGRLTSGKGERIGFILNETESKYNDYLIKNELVSIVGRDLAADSAIPYDGYYRNTKMFLNKSHFVTHDPYKLKDIEDFKKDDLERFYPDYVEELGIMTYLPEFSKKLNLWYFDVEFDINTIKGEELHSPFMQFAFVHYQEYSVDYNDPSRDDADISQDCRISEIYKSGSAYILGSRIFNFELKSGSILITMQHDKTSLNVKNPSKFYAAVQRRIDGDLIWKTAEQLTWDDKKAFMVLNGTSGVENPRLKFLRHKGHDYQLLIIETEEWGNTFHTSIESITESCESRIININIIKIY